MADRNLQQIVTQLKTQSDSLSYEAAAALLSKAKLLLLQLKALTPPTTSLAASSSQQQQQQQQPSPAIVALARETYEQGALYSIRARDPDAFTRYVGQLQPFYALLGAGPPATRSGAEASEQRSKVTGLYLLLLLTQGRYGEFHSELEALATTVGGSPGAGVVNLEGDRFLAYPIRLERWLMEGSYDQVWRSMKSREVPCEEYGVFSEILTSQIRSEIASSSERAYPSLPLSSTKSLLFLDSEGAVLDFARHRGWVVRDGHIFFPAANATNAALAAGGAAAAEHEAQAQQVQKQAEEKQLSEVTIENALGYARQLETIV